jgi:penicillin-insensitive murein endopeptidase
MHIRMVCPPGSGTCKSQAPVGTDEECGAPLERWLKLVRKPDVPPPPPREPAKPKPPPPPLKLADLPGECRMVLEAPDAAVAATEAASGVVPVADPEDQPPAAPEAR